jgi:small acid-soluble spore protein P (minor)
MMCIKVMEEMAQMAKAEAYSVGAGNPKQRQERGRISPTQQEPLSGSKKVKNRNHSRNNHGEGH